MDIKIEPDDEFQHDTNLDIPLEGGVSNTYEVDVRNEGHSKEERYIAYVKQEEVEIDYQNDRENTEVSEKGSRRMAENSSSKNNETVDKNTENDNSETSTKPILKKIHYNLTKIIKNNGEKYRRNYTIKNASQIGEDCRCLLKCFERVVDSEKKGIFNRFWKLGNYDLQNNYLQSLVSIIPVKRRYKKKYNAVNTNKSLREITVYYGVAVSNGESIKVCKKAFISLHGISRGRVTIVVSKKQNTLFAPWDLRETHKRYMDLQQLDQNL